MDWDHSERWKSAWAVSSSPASCLWASAFFIGRATAPDSDGGGSNPPQ